MIPKFRELINNKGLKIGSVGSLGIKLCGALLSFAVSILLARYLGLREYGVYVLVFSIILLLSIPLTMGLPLLVVRYLPKYELNSNRSAIRGLLKWSHRFVFINYLVIAGICLLIYYLFKDEFYTKFAETFGLGLLLLPFLGFSEVGAAALRGLRYIIPGQLPDIFLRSFFLLIGIIVYVTVFDTITPQGAMATHVISACFSYVFVRWVLHKKLLRSLKDVSPVYETKKWLRDALQFTGNMGINKLKMRIPTYLLAVWGGPGYVGLYEVAIKGSKTVIFCLTAINGALGPFISRCHAKNDMSDLQRIITKATQVIFLTSLPVALVFILGGPFLIDLLYGTDFKGSYLPLAILCVAQLINAAAGSVGLLLKMTGHQRFVLQVNAVNTFVNLIIAIPLVVYFNVIGAAIAYGFLLIVQNGIFVWYAQKKLSIRTTII